MQFNYQTGQSTIGSDRLRKAIERNKAKQAKQDKRSPSREVSDIHSRISVARSAQESQIVTPIKKENSGLSFGLSYREKKSKTKSLSSTAGIKNKFSIILPVWARKVGWILCAVIFLRLIFSSGGLIDFYSKNKVFENFENEYSNYEAENLSLKEEIHKITNAPVYQKKLVRDHLGFISKEEFLILFASER